MTLDLSIIIVNFNAGTHLAQCLASLVACLRNLAWEALVVDNASSDGSEAVAVDFDPRVRLIRNGHNIGFGRAVNQGASAARASRLLILNPDGRLLPEAVEDLIAELDSHADCAIIGPAVVNDDGTIQGSGRGDPNMLTGLFGRSSLLTRLFPNARLSRQNVVTPTTSPTSARSVEVDWISGACMLARRDAFDQVRGFDEQFFLYWEDADLCRRLRLVGWRTRYMPGTQIVHTVGQSSRTAPVASIRAFHRSAYLYYVRYSASSPGNPLRWIAALLLAVRCGWKAVNALSRRGQA